MKRKPFVWRLQTNRQSAIGNRKSEMESLLLSNITHRPARTAVSIAGIAVGVVLIVFTVGLAHGLLRERGKREANIGAEIMVRPSGTIGLSGGQMFSIPVAHAAELM